MNRLIKTLHIVFACLWLGSAASVVVLHCLVGWSADHRQLASLNIELAALDATLIIPGAIGSLLTGTWMCATTAWHFFRYRWVIAKWIGMLLGLVLGALALGPLQIGMVNISGGLDGPPVSGGPYDSIRLPFTALGFLQVYLLIAMVAISIMKPWGKRLSRRKEERTSAVLNATRAEAQRSMVYGVDELVGGGGR